MLQTKFQAAESSGSAIEDFLIFVMYFYGSNLVHVSPCPGPSWTLGPLFGQTW